MVCCWFVFGFVAMVSACFEREVPLPRSRENSWLQQKTRNRSIAATQHNTKHGAKEDGSSSSRGSSRSGSNNSRAAQQSSRNKPPRSSVFGPRTSPGFPCPAQQTKRRETKSEQPRSLSHSPTQLLSLSLSFVPWLDCTRPSASLASIVQRPLRVFEDQQQGEQQEEEDERRVADGKVTEDVPLCL